MPTTPGLTIPTGPAWDRVFAAFHGSAEEYKTWLRQALTSEVLRRERQAAEETLAEQQAAAAIAVKQIMTDAT